MDNIYMNKSTLMVNSNNICYFNNQSSNSEESKIEDSELSRTSSVAISPRNIPSQTQAFKRTYEGNIVPGGNLDCLYPYMYQLFKGQKVDLSDLDSKIETGNSLISCIKTVCIRMMKKFESLGKEDRSYLNVLLSGCINTLTVSHQLTLINMMGVERLQNIYESERELIDKNDGWYLLKDNMKQVLKDGGMTKLRCFVTEERLKIYQRETNHDENLKLKILDVFEYIFNMVQYKDWRRSNLSEEDYCLYWKTVFGIMFRGKDVLMRQGEQCSLASKFQRQANEVEFGDISSNVMGRRLDFSFGCTLYDDKNKPSMIDICSAEIKPENTGNDIKNIQLNKNIRVNKAILYLLLQHMPNNQKERIYTIGIDMAGLQGYFYKVVQYEDAVVALKLAEDDIFLPSDEDDLHEFLSCDAMDQLIFFVNHICSLKSSVKKASKVFKRTRATANTTSGIQSRMQSPPRRNPPFPSSTFFTPKRVNTKMDYDLISE
ncbi:hypothetical protein BCV72DRAFT_308046 [Rhizopus microsporus var. microsporus]|uniref:Uncharacterized protein n=2 Tax=Rhizopus microsporus TaxID=58291 RepID=A0A2G4SI59_RHIZD|nr:uncharacterized protein RHIMIDRAFT_241487 [Rhizopus microsporus ATCC 52813]ORE03601.1 hypothetical protein BCV72DRAFT_308046 [Rhizopus microsporus var. microsporus]PHZ08467.1 hypothetical protein RHIMIDRAFT_241487 [Rhizopus microsporus ATCC 52813]